MNKNYQYLSDEHAQYIKDIIKEVENRDKKYEIFGAERHKYKLNETVSLEWVREFEQKYHVELPEEYVFFITKVGNGGVSPFYGIEPLSMDDKYAKFYENLSKESMYNDNYFQICDKCSDYFENEGNYDEEYLDKKYFELSNELYDRIKDGVLNINTQGCTFDTLLVVNGSRKGEIVYIDWNLEIENPPFLTNMTFLEWYQGFFEEIIAGYSDYNYGYYMLGNEKELIEKYKTADSETKSKIIWSFYKFENIEQETLQFILNFDGVQNISRMTLAFKFDLQKGMKIFEDLMEGDREKVEIALELWTQVPKVYRDKYYDKMLDVIYGDFSDELKRHALFFIQETERFSASDLIDFLKNKENSESIRKSCIYVINSAADEEKFVDIFIEILHNMENEDLSMETVLTLSNIKDKRIAEAYKELIPKYEESDFDFMIVRNMKHYLKNMV